MFIRDCDRRTVRLVANEPDRHDAAEYAKCGYKSYRTKTLRPATGAEVPKIQNASVSVTYFGDAQDHS